MTTHKPVYRPTDDEINELAARIIRKYPHLKSRTDKAVAILQARGIEAYHPTPTAQRWTVASQSDPDRGYWIENSGCQCADYIKRGATAHGRAFCKHLIAYHIYVQIILEHAVRLLNSGDASLEHGQLIGPRIGHVGMNYTGGKWRFAEDRSAAVFATSLPRYYAALEEAEPARSGEWPPSGSVAPSTVFHTPADLDHYISTGEIPALRAA